MEEDHPELAIDDNNVKLVQVVLEKVRTHMFRMSHMIDLTLYALDRLRICPNEFGTAPRSVQSSPGLLEMLASTARSSCIWSRHAGTLSLQSLHAP